MGRKKKIQARNLDLHKGMKNAPPGKYVVKGKYLKYLSKIIVQIKNNIVWGL